MVSSVILYNVVADNANTIEFRNPIPISKPFDKNLYYNRENKPLNELFDDNGNLIDPKKVRIVNGFKPYSKSERAMVIQNMAKEWFVQWCEVAYYYDEERKKHINDYVWNIMCGGTPPGPTPHKQNRQISKNFAYTSPGGGSIPTQYALDNVFRIMPVPLLDNDNWYILYEEENLSEDLPE